MLRLVLVQRDLVPRDRLDVNLSFPFPLRLLGRESPAAVAANEVSRLRKRESTALRGRCFNHAECAIRLLGDIESRHGRRIALALRDDDVVRLTACAGIP